MFSWPKSRHVIGMMAACKEPQFYFYLPVKPLKCSDKNQLYLIIHILLYIEQTPFGQKYTKILAVTNIHFSFG